MGGQVLFVKLLLKSPLRKELNLDITDNEGKTALMHVLLKSHHVSKAHYSDIAKILIEMGASIETNLEFNISPFMYAMGNEFYEIAEILLKR